MSAHPTPVRSTILKKDAKGVVRHGAEWLQLWSDPDSLKSKEEKRLDRDAYRERLELGHQLSAAARSLSGDVELDVGIGTGAASGLKVELDELERANLPALRGRLDSGALFRRFHDPDLHRSLAPRDEIERRLFDLCEAVRCEALGAQKFPGVEENLIAFHRDRLEKADLIGAHLASLIPLAEALRMVLRDTLTGRHDPSIASSGFWMWDRWLRQRVSGPLAALADCQDSQAMFAVNAKHLIQSVFTALEGTASGPERRSPTSRRASEDASGTDEEERSDAEGGGEEQTAFEPGDELFSGDEPELLHELLHAMELERPPAYRAFSTAQDKVVRADSLADAETLRQARHRLDEKRAEFRRDFARLVVQLQRRLMALQTRSWTFDLEEGLIDAGRLDRVVVNPGFADAYKQEEESEFRDTVVTLLIDNSGSMRGAPIEIACIVSDLIAAALEQCHVAVEVLGFTTGAWKGGHAAQAWMKAGRPAEPGRLNDLLHIVYKSADEPLRRARNNLCAMLSNDVLKENVDGEALGWARGRLMQRPEARRVLIVISDGAPVDQATIEANEDKRILDRHLRQVVDEIEKAGQIELAAIGIKHDVGQYYRNAIRIEKVEELGTSLIELLDRMIVR